MTTSIYLFENSIKAITITGSYYKSVSGFFTKEGEEEMTNGDTAFVMQSLETKEYIYTTQKEIAKAIIFKRK